MKRDKIIYYIATGLLTFLMSFSAGMYFFKTEMVEGFFSTLGYPTYLVIPLAILKILGIVAIWTRLSPRLKEWAYFGFFLDFVLAGVAHYVAQDGGVLLPVVAIFLLIISYGFDKRVFGKVLV